MKGQTRQAQSDVARRHNLRLKREVFDAYGGTCVCCGETELLFLVLDHINDDGGEHRKSIMQEKGWSGRSGGGATTWRWLRDRNYPEGLVQILCANCNMAKAYGCPHEMESKAWK